MLWIKIAGCNLTSENCDNIDLRSFDTLKARVNISPQFILTRGFAYFKQTLNVLRPSIKRSIQLKPKCYAE